MQRSRPRLDNRATEAARSMDDISTLISRIDSMLQSSTEDDCADVRAHMESTLTDGYAAALALEAEHWRLQRRIGEIAAELADGSAKQGTKEIASLARRLALAEEELETLRETLTSLRARIALAARAA
jgi:ABC-type phosphate transport system auxiliary subunit